MRILHVSQTIPPGKSQVKGQGFVGNQTDVNETQY